MRWGGQNQELGAPSPGLPLLKEKSDQDMEDGRDSDLEHPDDLELDELTSDSSAASSPTTRTRPRWMDWSRRWHGGASYFALSAPRRRRSAFTRFCQLLAISPIVIASLILICGVFFPSYTYPPPRYTELQQRVQNSAFRTGSANVNNEKIFIVASIYDNDGELLGGDWGHAVSNLIDILGPENVYLSVYENDPDEKAHAALEEYGSHVKCNSSLVSEHLDLETLQHVSTPDGTRKLKRMAFLAEVRNRALRPIQEPGAAAYNLRFDKVLYLNDVIFDPVEAANLLFSTNADEVTGRTQYRAACAVDFINPFKFYDTFASRDTEGYRMGVPFYPWFTGAGSAETRHDVLSQTDAVKVKSCWGGMVAYEARWFQPWHHTAISNPYPVSNDSALRFRFEKDIYWDASECCLINADLSAVSSSELPAGETGIFMNPYVRVAYSKRVLNWLSVTRRFERLYTPIHTIANWIAARPSFNPRREQQAGAEVVDHVWVWDQESQEALENHSVGDLSEVLHGSYHETKRKAMPGSFCGHRKLSFINKHPAEGEKNWESVDAPAEKR
jgi:hypothetical protein